MKKVLFGLTCLVLTLPLVGGNRVIGQRKASDEFRKLMQDKLHSSQKLLEGLALANYRKISGSAERLIQISKTAEWVVHKTPRYEMHSNEFRRAAEGILQKARDKNLEGVALGYFDLTMTCIRCHQYVRDLRDARGPGAGTAVAWDGAR
jgi:hypothetical protein